MKNKLFDMASRLSDKASALLQEHKPNEQVMVQAKAWVKNAATVTAESAIRLGKDAMKSDLAKDAAKGAALGAAIAVPVPLIGPAFGAVVGAGIGVYANLTRSNQNAPQSLQSAPVHQAPVIDVVAAPPKDVFAELLKLDDLLKKGILTQAEFDAQKTKVLNGA
ncbi:MAG: SHOCT domain-containing protein [Burkholderiaceae bacterium]|nr:SHOCT domain-containing protein [Burkholderiaceae bacterium]